MYTPSADSTEPFTRSRKASVARDLEIATVGWSTVSKRNEDGLETPDEGSSPIALDDNGQKSRFSYVFRRYILALHLEERGIRRVEPGERHAVASFGNFQPALLWFGVNLCAINVTLGILGPAVFYLSFVDASVCAVLGSLMGSLGPAYIATFGPVSGNRAMVIARYVVGWYPGKIMVVLNMIVLLGYAMINTVIAGQILSAVSPHDSLSQAVGIIICAIGAWLVTTFGYKALQYYFRYAWVPQLMVFSILYGVAARSFDLKTPTQGDPATKAGARLSFFSLCLATAITYSGIASDYFVYYPESTSRPKLFSLVVLGLSTSFTYGLVLGAGLGSAIASNPSFGAAYERSQGALIVLGYESLGAFGHFCAVVAALGLIVNTCAGTYSSGVSFQVLGRLFAKVPRVVWNTLSVVIYTVCALAGRDHLAEIFTNFLALMGYWVAIWIAITLEEHLIFRRRSGFDWTSWNEPKGLPIGMAALIAFLVGWAGAILGMAQVWYVGPIAKLVGEYGMDMGNYLGFTWAALVFPPLRWWELRKFGR